VRIHCHSRDTTQADHVRGARWKDASRVEIDLDEVRVRRYDENSVRARERQDRTGKTSVLDPESTRGAVGADERKHASV
jgi:hypothetical protein